jgi:hypothetical protein
VAGTITFSHEAGISLEIIGNFYDQEDYFLINSQEIIIGITHGKLFTLMNCYFKKNRNSFPGIETQEYGVNIALSGYHFNNLEEIKFDRVQVDFNHLKYLSPFRFSWKDDINSNHNFTENNLSFYTLNDIKASITKCEILFKQFITTNCQPQEMSINKSAFIEIRLRDKESFDTINKKFISPLQSFITLASNKPNYITSLFLYLQIDGEIKEIEAIFQQSTFINHTDTFNKKDALFVLNDIKQDLSLIMQKWFNLFDLAEDIINLYFSTIYNDKLYIENKFLALVQVLESFHRSKFDKIKYLTEEHKEKLHHILEATPVEYKDWLEKKLQHSHEPSLDERLQELLQKTKEIMIPIIAVPEDFFQKVKKTRNYLTHYGDSLKDKSFSGDDLARATQILYFMVKACLLSELTCTTARCEELLSRNGKYQYLKTLASQART